LQDEGINIKYLDIGGGLGITYDNEQPPHPHEYAAAIQDIVKGLNCTLILEPGRVIAGNAGVLVTRVQHTKTNSAGEDKKRFVIVDAAMNDLTRPSLYGAYHKIIPVADKGRDKVKVDVVGPVCETGDFMAREREMDEVEPGDLLAIMSSGAYGFTMSSNYNSRPRVAEVLVNGADIHLIRCREDYDDLTRHEGMVALG
jgi:diaminopimelate decarboxylase